MGFEHKFEEWATEGVKSAPSEGLRKTGFEGGMKPPASVFNYMWNKVGKAINELQDYTTAIDPLVYSAASMADVDKALNSVLAQTETHSMQTFELSFTVAVQPLGGGTYAGKLYKISDKYSMVEMRVYGTPHPKIFVRSLFEGVWKDWVYLTNSGELSALQQNVDGKWDRLAVYKADADITLSPVILTNVGTLPTNEFWYVHTTFFGTVSETSARKQVAYGYTQNKMYVRTYYEGVWSDWTVVYTGNNKPTLAEIGAASEGLVSGLYPANNADEIDNALISAYGTMKDRSSKFITIFSNQSDLPLEGGGWHFIINRYTETNGVAFGCCYNAYRHLKMRFLRAGVWGDWQTVGREYKYSATDLTAGTSTLKTGELHFVYE